MRQRFTEGGVIFVSVLKWFFLASCVGVLVGTATYGFLEILKFCFSYAGEHPYYFVTLPVALFLSSLIIEYVSKEAGGYGTERVIAAVHRGSGKIKAIVIPAKLLATVITLAGGGSVGKVGPSAQIGAGLSSLVADVVGFSDGDRKKLVICGISAGFAAVFGAPIAGAIFGIEVLFVGGLLYDVLLPSFVAGIVSYQVASALGTTYLHHAIDYSPVFSDSFLLFVALSGVFFGLCSFFLIEVMRYGKRISSSIKLWPPLKGLIGGTILVVLAFIFSADYMGLGTGTIEAALSGEDVVWYAFLMKIVFTCVTFNAGGSGGMITPIFFIGATAGVFFATIFGLSTLTFSAIGLVSMLAGAVNTPITGSILALELFGPEMGSYAAVACIISFLMTGHRSVFPTQLLAFRKSASIAVDIGKDLQAQEPRYVARKRSLISVLERLNIKVELKDSGAHDEWPLEDEAKNVVERADGGKKVDTIIDDELTDDIEDGVDK
jgi:H+/Cl- antiporter ClcA